MGKHADGTVTALDFKSTQLSAALWRSQRDITLLTTDVKQDIGSLTPCGENLTQ